MYLCGECNNCFDDADVFDRHLEESHTNIKLNYVCEDCGETFKKLLHFQQHRITHDNVESEFVCEKCGKGLSDEDSFMDHLKECSQLQYQCPLCKKIGTKENMYTDIKIAHKIDLVSEKQTFDSFNDFVNWKDWYEQKNILCYIEGINVAKKDGGEFYQYYCHHGRPYQFGGDGDKKCSWCPSEIVADVNANGETLMTFIKTHIGHRPGIDINKLLPENNITSLEISDTSGTILSKVKEEIEDSQEVNIDTEMGQASGVEIKNLFSEVAIKVEDNADDILNDAVNSTLNNNGIKSYTKLDLTNELKDYVTVKGGRQAKANSAEAKPRSSGRGAKSFQSLESWVMESTNKESVMFFKAQGETSAKYPQLELNRYILLITLKAPMEILKRFGEKLVCIDRQYGENLELVTVLVIEDLNQSFPCAFLVTNKADAMVMEVLFNEIKEAVGIIQAKLFMSERSSFVSDAWNKTMGVPDKKLFCSWSVLKDWRIHMRTIINMEKQELTYKALKNLLEEPDEKTFTSLFQLVLSELQTDPETADFGNYLSANYAEATDTWACCFRPGEGIQDNGTLEKIHGVLKQILQGNTKRLDRAINALLSFLRSKIYDRLLLMSKGKISSKLTEVANRHKFALKYKYQVINHGEYWAVVSAKKEVNRVKLSNQSCDCQGKCKVCNICAHIYICTCFDSLVRLNMCRHIHALCIAETEGNVAAGDGNGSWESGLYEVETDFEDPNSTLAGQTLSNTLFQEGSEILYTEQYSSQLVPILPGSNDNGEDFCADKESESSLAHSLEARKTNLEALFKSLISEVSSEKHLVEVEKALSLLERKLRKPKPAYNRSPKKRVQSEEKIKFIQSDDVIQNNQMPRKKMRISKVYKPAI